MNHWKRYVLITLVTIVVVIALGFIFIDWLGGL